MAERPFPIDFAALTPDSRPRTWLVLPPGFAGAVAPDADSPVFAVPPPAALEAFMQAGLAEARVKVLRREAGQVELVQRSLVFRFPDYVTAEAFPAGQGGSALAIYSRAAVGHYDFKVNQRRVERWLAGAQARL